MLLFLHNSMETLGERSVLALCCALAVGSSAMAVDGEESNDLCSEPTSVGEGSFEFSTLHADTDGPDYSSCVTLESSIIYNDVWFEFTAPETGTLTISTCGQAEFDTRIALYAGECGALTEIGCNDDGAGCPGYTSLLLVPSVKDERYLIRIGGFHPSQKGDGTLTISIDPPCFHGCDENIRSEMEACGEFSNDGCSGDLLGVENEAFARDLAYGHEAINLNETVCGTWQFDGTVRDTDWYRVVVPEPGASLSVLLESSEFIEANLYLAAESCPLELLDYVTGGCPTTIDLEWAPAGSYLIIVAPGFEQVVECGDGFGLDQYSLSVSGEVSTENAPLNDACSDALQISDGFHPFSTFYASTDGAADSPVECGDYGTAIGADIWFDYMSPVTGDVTVSVCDLADFDTRLEVRLGACDGPMVGCNDDSDGCSGYTSSVTFSAICDERFVIRLAGYELERGDGTLEVSSSGGCCTGDLDGDGVVGGSDLATLLSVWASDDSRADFDGDGIVGGADLAAILAAWGGC